MPEEDRCSRNWGAFRFQPLIEVDQVLAHAMDYDKNNVVFTARTEGKKDLMESLAAERFVLDWFKSLHFRKPSKYCGEMISGGTEGTLTALWHMREYFRSKGFLRIIVLLSEHTHFSAVKSCQILNIEYRTVRSLPGGQYEDRHLRQVIECEIREERGTAFALVGTLGFAMTGQSDDLRYLSKIKRFYGKNNPLLIHLDAAAGGLCVRFLDKNLPYFDQCGVDSVSTDFHKAGMCQFGTAVVIMESELYHCLSFSVPYAPEVRDYALLGSRSSLPALAAQAVIRALGDQWISIYRETLKKRKYFLHEISVFPQLRVISEPPDLPMLALAIDGVYPQLRKMLQTEINAIFFPLKGKDGRMYENCFRMYFNRQITKADIDLVIEAVRKTNGK